MRIRTCSLALLAISWAWLCSSNGLAKDQKGASVEVLLRNLQVEKSSSEAADELLRRGAADAETRNYLVRHLPGLLEKYQPNMPGAHGNLVWWNEAKLAGELKIVESVPGLIKGIDIKAGPGSGGSLGYNFYDYDAVWSLILIGPPAVPALVSVLKHGTALRRREAAYVLGEIGTDRAREALTAAHKREADTEVRSRIEEALKRPRR